MKPLIVICFLVPVFVLQVLNSFGQPDKLKSLRWNAKTGKYTRVERVPVRPATPDSGKYITAHTMRWVFPTAQLPGHWERMRARDMNERLAQQADYSYRIRNLPYQNYNGPVNISIDRIVERTDLLGQKRVISAQLVSGGAGNRVDVHFAKTIHLGKIVWAATPAQILVVDSLIIPASNRNNATFAGTFGNVRPLLKIVAATIVFESPARLDFTGTTGGDFLYSCDTIVLKTVYPDLKLQDLTPAPPPIMALGQQRVSVMRQRMSAFDGQLLNRLYVKLMQQYWTDLLSEEDEWIQDRLVNQFQVLRYRKINAMQLANDAAPNQVFQQLVRDFEARYANRLVSKVRLLENMQVIASGDNLRPLRYFVIPNIATVQPLLEDTAIGVVEFTGTGDAALKVSVEVALGCDSQTIKNVASALGRKGLTLEPKLEESTLKIGQQPLKIAGVTVGKITPISNRMLRLDFDVTEGAASIARWFPKDGHAVFQVDAVASNDPTVIVQQVGLHLDQQILDKLDYTKPLDRFHVVERTPLTGELKLSSHVSAAREREGALNFIEVLVDIQHDDRSTVYGPFRLSSYNTTASEKIIAFLKYADTFKAVVSGRAVYDNGEIVINPFERTSTIITLEDAMLSSSSEPSPQN